MSKQCNICKKFSVQFEKICMNWPINPSQSCSNIFGKFVYSSLFQKKILFRANCGLLTLLCAYKVYIFATAVVPQGFHVNTGSYSLNSHTLNWVRRQGWDIFFKNPLGVGGRSMAGGAIKAIFCPKIAKFFASNYPKFSAKNLRGEG